MKKALLCVFILLVSVNVFAGDVDIEQLTEKANNGNAEAQFQLANSYYFGNGVMRDFEQAAYWFTKATEQGHVKAPNGLGSCYLWGLGVAQDTKQGYMWLSVSLSLATDEREIKTITEFLEVNKGDMTPADIAEAKQMAVEWMERH